MTKLLFIIMLLSVSYDNDRAVVWEQLTKSQQQSIISGLPKNSIVKKYYDKEFKLSDDARTFSLLDTLVNVPNDKKMAAFYVHFFNTILLSSDGALSEGMEGYCCELFERAPAIIMTEFEYNKDLIWIYAFGIARTYILNVDSDDDFDRAYKLAMEQSGDRKDTALYFVELIKQYRDKEIEDSIKQKEYIKMLNI